MEKAGVWAAGSMVAVAVVALQAGGAAMMAAAEAVVAVGGLVGVVRAGVP